MANSKIVDAADSADSGILRRLVELGKILVAQNIEMPARIFACDSDDYPVKLLWESSDFVFSLRLGDEGSLSGGQLAVGKSSKLIFTDLEPPTKILTDLSQNELLRAWFKAMRQVKRKPAKKDPHEL